MNQLSQSSPVRFTVKRKYVNDLSPYTLSYIKRKWNDLLEGAKDQFFEAIAPGQGKMLCELLHQGSDNSVPYDLQMLIKKYKDSDSLSQMVILSLVDHDKYSRAEVNYFPGCKSTKLTRQDDGAKKVHHYLFQQKKSINAASSISENVNIF